MAGKRAGFPGRKNKSGLDAKVRLRQSKADPGTVRTKGFGADSNFGRPVIQGKSVSGEG